MDHHRRFLLRRGLPVLQSSILRIRFPWSLARMHRRGELLPVAERQKKISRPQGGWCRSVVSPRLLVRTGQWRARGFQSAFRRASCLIFQPPSGWLISNVTLRQSPSHAQKTLVKRLNHASPTHSFNPNFLPAKNVRTLTNTV